MGSVGTTRCAVVAALVLGLLLPVRSVGSADTVSHALWRQAGAAFGAWELAGANAESGELRLAAEGLSEGVDRYGANGYRGGNYYNGGTFWSGEGLSPVREVPGGFDELIPAWNADTPDGTWIEVRVTVRQAGEWSPDYTFGVWASSERAVRRHSVAEQNDERAKVATDTLILKQRADAFRLRTVLFTADTGLTPILRGLSAATSRLAGAGAPPVSLGGAGYAGAAGIDLPVPERSQMIYPGGGEVWCSPTSTSMVMAYWAERVGARPFDRAVPEAAAGTYDWIYRGNGNWPFNTAYAASWGLDGVVTRLYGLAQVEAWIAAGVPVVLSLAYELGELANAPLARTGGHLLVVRGFTPDGDAIVNDPAANPNLGQSVRRVYQRAQLERVWLSHSQGVVYLISPPDWHGPSGDSLGAW